MNPDRVDLLEVVEDVRRACLEQDGQDPVDESVHLLLKNRGLSATEHWIEPDGFALRHDGELDLAVAPAARGHGAGSRLATAAVAAPGPLTAWSHGDHPAAAALATRLGFARARELWVMRRPTAVPLPVAQAPDGIRLRDFGGAADAESLLRVNAAAFAHHPEQGAMTAEDLAERMAEPWFDPAGLFLAVDEDGDVLGFHWTKRHDAAHGEVYVVGIAPTAQGRGLGRALTLAGLHHLASRGLAEVHLYVEADNQPAVRLYTSLGFTHSPTDTHVQYLRSPAK